MADPEVKIKVTANTTQAQSALSGLNKSWIGVNSALDLGKKAAQFLGDAYNALVGDTQEYAQAVLKMTRVSGQSAEMTSRLIELTDDFGIAQETLSVAMRTATRNGIEFSVNKLAALSDQYLSLPEGIARAQMAAETFGSRAGPEMQKLLEKGSDAIRDQAAAIDEHMLMTEEDLEASEQLRIAQDNLSDSVTALGRTIGKELIPPLATAADAANMLLTNEGKLDDAFNEHKQTVISTAATYEEYMNEMLRAAVVAGKIPQSVYDTWKDTPEILEESALELGFLSRRSFELQSAAQLSDQALQGLLLGTLDLAPAFSGLSEEAAELASKLREELIGAYQDVQSASEGWAKGAGDDLIEMLDTADLKSGDLTEAIIAVDSAMGTSEYNTRLQKDAMQKLVDQYKKTGDVDAFKEGLARLKNGGFQPLTDSIITARVQLEELLAKMREIDGQTATGYVNIISGSGGGTMTAPKYDSMGAGDTSYVPDNVYIPHRAGGGNVRGGSPYIVGENGPEMFVPGRSGAIVPNDKLGNITLNFYGPTSPAAVESAVRRTMKSYGHQYQGG